MSDKTYDRIKAIALFAAPVLTFLTALATIWGAPNAEVITATMAAVDTLLGSIVISAKKIHDKETEE